MGGDDYDIQNLKVFIDKQIRRQVDKQVNTSIYLEIAQIDFAIYLVYKDPVLETV